MARTCQQKVDTEEEWIKGSLVQFETGLFVARLSPGLFQCSIVTGTVNLYAQNSLQAAEKAQAHDRDQDK